MRVLSDLSGNLSIPKIGTGTTYVCPAQGNLELRVNDTDVEDNSGEFGVFVTRNE